MKYLPAVAAALAVGGSVVVGLILTKNPNCLWGLAFLVLCAWLTPDE